MPISIDGAFDDHGELAAAKATKAHDLPRYLVSAALAGAYVGVGVVLLVGASAGLMAEGSGLLKLVQGSAFGAAAKLIVLWWALLAFIVSGFEHSVANMTTFAIGASQGSSGWSELGANLVWTVPGNIVGGAAVASAYVWLGPPPRRVSRCPPPRHRLTGPRCRRTSRLTPRRRGLDDAGAAPGADSVHRSSVTPAT